MLGAELDMDALVDVVVKKVMRIVNKHHYSFREDIAIYRNEVRKLEKALTHFQHQYVNEMNAFHRKHDYLPAKLDEIQEFVSAHLNDVQNAHEKLLELESRQRDVENLMKNESKRSGMKIDLNTCPFEDSGGLLKEEWIKLTLVANNTKGSVLLCAERIKTKDDVADALVSCIRGLVDYCYGEFNIE